MPPAPLPPVASEHTGNIRLATESDIKTIMWLQDAWRSSIGYLNRAAHAERIEKQGTLLIFENGEPAGYICTHPGQDSVLWTKQVAIHADLLRSTLGTLIMQRMITTAAAHGCTMIRLRSRPDLPANQFWPGLGFQFAGQMKLRTKKRTVVNEWTRPLTPSPNAPTPRIVQPAHQNTLSRIDWRHTTDGL